MDESLKYAIIILTPFAVQLIILFLTANRFWPLRFAVPVLTGVAAVVDIVAGILSSNGMWAALYVLAVIFVILGLGLVLTGWALAWPVYYLIKYLTKRKVSDIR